MRQGRLQYWSYLAAGAVAMIVVAAISSQDTWATYTSRAVSGKNIMRGGSIELSVLPNSLPEGRKVTLTADSRHSYSTVVRNDGYSTLGYRAGFITSGDVDFCSVLHLAAKHTGKEVYTGRLIDFEYVSEDPLEHHQKDEWQFSIGIPESITKFDKAAACELHWHLDAWQDRFLPLGMGWYDGVDGETIVLGIAPAQSSVPSVKESDLPEPSLVVPVAAESIVPDESSAPNVEPVSDPGILFPTLDVEEEVSNEPEI